MVRAFDPSLQRWFQAVTREVLNELMNHPRFVALRLAANERREEEFGLNARHGAHFRAEAKSKRIHQNAKRLSAQRKGGFINNSFAIVGGPYLFTNERLHAA